MSLVLDGSVGVTFPSGAVGNSALMSGTAQASTSGTSIDFTGIPSWVKRITVMLNGVSTSGTSNILLQIGSGSVTTTGYASSSGSITASAATSTAGFIQSQVIVAANTYYGIFTIALLGSNTYVGSGNLSTASANNNFINGGALALGGAIDRVRLTTVNGTDTFDAGSINILYE